MSFYLIFSGKANLLPADAHPVADDSRETGAASSFMLVPFSAVVSVLQGWGRERQHSVCHSAVSAKDGAVGKSRSLRCPHQSHPCAAVIPSLQRQQSGEFQDEPTL